MGNLAQTMKNCFCDKQRLIRRPIGSLIRLLQGTTTCISIFLCSLLHFLILRIINYIIVQQINRPNLFTIVKNRLIMKMKTSFLIIRYIRPGFAIVPNYELLFRPSLLCNDTFIIFLLDLTIPNCNTKMLCFVHNCIEFFL